MHIYDQDGNKIFITDLDKAIQQANDYKDYRHESEEFRELDETLHQYWKDVLDKLLKLKDGESS